MIVSITPSSDAPVPGGDRRPLAGIRVIDLSHLLSGPFATMLLADNGADVVKVERPTGDIARQRHPHRTGPSAPRERASAYFLAVNRGKRSVVLDLKSEAGRRALSALISSADVVVENFRPGVLARLGVDLSEIMLHHPSLIVASLSAFGGDDIAPRLRDRPGVAIVAEAASGITGVTRGPDGLPIWVGWALGDLVGGLVLYGAITTALAGRARTGTGARLDLSMAESMLALYAPTLAMHALGSTQTTNAVPPAIPFGVYPALDGYVALGVNSDEFWRRLCVAMARPELAADSRYRTYPDRIGRRTETDGLVKAWTATLSRGSLVALLEAHGVPCALVGDPDDVLSDAAFIGRRAFWQVDDGLGGTITLPANPMRFASSSPGPVPRLGEHTAEILRELGLGPEEA